MPAAGPEPGPAPDGGPLTVVMACRTSPTARGGVRHPVTIRRDWTVDVPHDLAAERVATAFGGYLSCLPLVDHSIPALRAALPLLTRRARARLRRAGSRWCIPGELAAGCCATREFPSAGHAAQHLRSAAHLALVHGAPSRQLTALLSAVAAVHGPWEGEPPSAPPGRLVREPDGVAELWRAGVHPDEIARLAAPAAVVLDALPLSYYLGLAYGAVDPEWLERVVRHRPDADTAAWLAGLPAPESLAPAEDWGAWLDAGLARRDVLFALSAGIPTRDIDAVAAATGWPRPAAARNLLAFAEVGCLPPVERFADLAARGIERLRPSLAAIDGACDDIRRALRDDGLPDRPVERTEVAVLLELLGSRPAVLAAFRRGVRSVADLDPRPAPRHARFAPDAPTERST